MDQIRKDLGLDELTDEELVEKTDPNDIDIPEFEPEESESKSCPPKMFQASSENLCQQKKDTVPRVYKSSVTNNLSVCCEEFEQVRRKHPEEFPTTAEYYRKLDIVRYRAYSTLKVMFERILLHNSNVTSLLKNNSVKIKDETLTKLQLLVNDYLSVAALLKDSISNAINNQFGNGQAFYMHLLFENLRVLYDQHRQSYRQLMNLLGTATKGTRYYTSLEDDTVGQKVYNTAKYWTSWSIQKLASISAYFVKNKVLSFMLLKFSFFQGKKIHLLNSALAPSVLFKTFINSASRAIGFSNTFVDAFGSFLYHIGLEAFSVISTNALASGIFVIMLLRWIWNSVAKSETAKTIVRFLLKMLITPYSLTTKLLSTNLYNQIDRFIDYFFTEAPIISQLFLNLPEIFGSMIFILGKNNYSTS